MYKGPQISNERAIELSSNLGLDISNRSYKGVSYPVIKEGSKVIDTAINYISEDYASIINSMKGDVLILGLGMGCGVIGACDNKQVKSITVVEKNQAIIELFWELYGSKFEGVEKLSVCHNDAIEYKGKGFSDVFIDIFHPPFDKEYYKHTMDSLRGRYSSLNVHFIDLY